MRTKKYCLCDAYLDAMLAAFQAGQPPPVPAQAGRRALALALAAIESFETGRRVDTAELALPNF